MKPKLHGPAASALDFLRRDDTTAALLPAAQRHLKLRQDVLALVPAVLRETCEVAESEDGTLSISVSSASAAAKLRQTLPRLRDGLLDRGWKVSAIRMRIQPRAGQGSTGAHTARQGVAMTAAGVEAFSALTEALPDSPLKSAVDRLVSRRGG